MGNEEYKTKFNKELEELRRLVEDDNVSSKSNVLCLGRMCKTLRSWWFGSK